MDITIRVPDSLAGDRAALLALRAFVQRLVDRWALGGQRYGAIDKAQRYLSRLRKELDTYRETGNGEQLLNIAVYAFLEFEAPQHKSFHFNPLARSATRKRGRDE